MLLLGWSGTIIVFGIAQGLTMTFDSGDLIPSKIVLASVLSWGSPSMLTLLSFSLFAYYIAKLNIQIEKSQI